MLIKIGEYKQGLLDIIEGFFYNYRKFGLIRSEHQRHATYLEIDYFKRLGEMLNFYAEIEARRNSNNKPADLVWVNGYSGEYYKIRDLVLHLERESRGWENVKIRETVSKLFDK